MNVSHAINQKYMRSFLHIYEKEIAPKLQEIDVFLKADLELLDTAHAAKLLYITEEEVFHIMEREQIAEINIFTFFMIMKEGSSSLCQLFKRELERGTKTVYSIDDISYIYNIPIDQIKDACIRSGIHQITANSLKILFSYITMNMYN